MGSGERQVNGVYQALAHPTRREVLALLRAGGMAAGEVAARLGVPKPTLSGHLRVLQEAGLVYGERKGTSITYHLNASVLEEALMALLDLLGVDRAEREEARDHG